MDKKKLILLKNNKINNNKIFNYKNIISNNKINDINDIKNIFYINLENRIDRKNHVENELNKMNLVGERFNAIKNDKGFIGCTLSHIECLKLALQRNYDHVLICEDDITFLEPELFKNKFNKFIMKYKNWDVILFSGNGISNYIKLDEDAIKINKCLTTTGYLVNGHYIKKLLNNFEESLIYNIPLDVNWFKLQQKDIWFLIIPITVVQCDSYSDIENQNVSYSKYIQSFNKLLK